jgi:hypothetical protein
MKDFHEFSLHVANTTASVKPGGLCQHLQSPRHFASITHQLAALSFTQVFDARFAAALTPDGYRSFAPLHYGRVQDDVLQFFVAHCSDGPRAQLSLEAGSLLLCEPHGFLSFDIGGTFPDEQRSQTYTTSNDAQWQHTVELAVLDYLTIGRPRMAKRAKLTDLMDHVFTLLGHSGSPHLWFTLAAGHARLGEESKARDLAQEALIRYRKCAEHDPRASWPQKGEQRCERLVHALYAVQAERLLEGWKAGTVAALGVQSLVAG